MMFQLINIVICTSDAPTAEDSTKFCNVYYYWVEVRMLGDQRSGEMSSGVAWCGYSTMAGA